jgi:hypothetical protein
MFIIHLMLCPRRPRAVHELAPVMPEDGRAEL